MWSLLLDALAGWGLLCLGSTVILAAILCVDWRDWRARRRRQRTHMATRCRYCNYTGQLDKVTAHETQDHAERSG
jgi:hypothetical protein